MEPRSSTEFPVPSSFQQMSQACKCVVQSKASSVNLLGFVFLLGQQHGNHCPSHSNSLHHGGPTSSFEIHTISKTSRLGIICHWNPKPPSISVTLKAEFRTKRLPLLRAFKGLCLCLPDAHQRPLSQQEREVLYANQNSATKSTLFGQALSRSGWFTRQGATSRKSMQKSWVLGKFTDSLRISG